MLPHAPKKTVSPYGKRALWALGFGHPLQTQLAKAVWYDSCWKPLEQMEDLGVNPLAALDDEKTTYCQA